LTGKTPLVIILGPTAVGKTSLAIETAQALGGEIINADSRQIYRAMDIGTAKPTSQQQASVPHHLLDVVNPDETLSLAQYQERAYRAIDEISTRGHIPLLVGGTGLYITAVVEGWTIPEVPPNLPLREELEAFAREQGAAALHERLRQLDPTAADKIDYRNIRRVVRAIEIYLTTGQPMDYTQRKQPPPYPVLLHGLTMDRERLYQQADQRIDQMMDAGFLAEVEHLLTIGYRRDLPAMTGLGYAQLAAHLQGECSLEVAVEETRKATRDFIRKQYTWFRGHDTGIQWHDREALKPAQWIHEIARQVQEL
jgi:tRNA dimethylallyltransferase